MYRPSSAILTMLLCDPDKEMKEMAPPRVRSSLRMITPLSMTASLSVFTCPLAHCERNRMMTAIPMVFLVSMFSSSAGGLVYLIFIRFIKQIYFKPVSYSKADRFNFKYLCPRINLCAFVNEARDKTQSFTFC